VDQPPLTPCEKDDLRFALTLTGVWVVWLVLMCLVWI
jgi:hypothetical protein